MHNANERGNCSGPQPRARPRRGPTGVAAAPCGGIIFAERRRPHTPRSMPSPRHALTVLVLSLSVACGRGRPAPAGLPTPAPVADAGPDARRDAARIRVGAIRRGPQTRAERYRYGETSTYVDVVRFLDSLKALGAPITVGAIGRSPQRRDIPYAIASRPAVATPDEARALDRPVVYVQANIHGGEVEGKEALQALLRDLTLGPTPNVLDSIVLVAVPIYNADGNERIALQARNRPEQNGPDLVGDRPNGQGLDLNRDYVKAEAPETRASLEMFDRWQPDVFVDLHTTDGSYHGYALTYSPPLHPAAPLGTYAHDIFLPELRRRVQARRGVATFPYGNFSQEYGADVNTDTVKRGWYTYDHRARYGTNYFGLRGRLAVLSEA